MSDLKQAQREADRRGKPVWSYIRQRWMRPRGRKLKYLNVISIKSFAKEG